MGQAGPRMGQRDGRRQRLLISEDACFVQTTGPTSCGTGHIGANHRAGWHRAVAGRSSDRGRSDGMVLGLDAAARRLWEALQIGCTVDDLVQASVLEGDLPEKVARSNITRTLTSWRALALIKSGAEGNGAAPAAMPVAEPGLWLDGSAATLDAVYQPGDHPVRVRCNDAALAGVIDAACRSCRVAADGHFPAVDVIEQEGSFAIRADGVVLTRADDLTQNPALARHRCLTALLEIARRPRRWLGILHASAVALDGRCVVFAGAKGSGKSTLAAALVASGADLVTDDYAPLEQGAWHVWPVPYAPGIKRGSWRPLRRYYPDIYERRVHRLAGMQIRYLQLEPARIAPLDHGLTVAALVFPRYQAGGPLEHGRLTTAEAFAELCHARPLLDRQPDVLAETLRWIESVPAYRLTHGDLDLATKWTLSLLEVE
jgi:hypothetical protein